MRFRGDAARRSMITVLACVGCALLAPAVASAGWDPVEPVPVAGDVTDIFAAPGGPGYVIGFPLAGSFRAAARPFGGVVGAPIPFPGAAGTNFQGSWEFDAVGNALIANTSTGTVTYRAANGTGGASQQMPAGQYPKSVSVAPSGEAMVGLNTSPSGPVQVAFRAAGPGATVDLGAGKIETFSASGVLIGLLLQPDGGAIVVWQEGDVLKQAVRPPGGAPSFDPPTVIADPRPDPRKSGVVFRADPSGHAMLTWAGFSAPSVRDQAVATVRTPNGGFPAASIIGTGGSIVNVYPAITANGAGIATWRHDFTGGASTPATVMGATVHAGTWAPQAPVGPSAYPLVSIPTNVPVAGTSDVAVPMIQIEDAGTPAVFSDDRRGLFVHHYRSTPTGLVDQGISELAPLQKRAGGTTPNMGVDDIAMEPGGKILTAFNIDGVKSLRSFDGVPPGTPVSPVVVVPPAPAPPAGPPKAIAPIVAKNFVILKPGDPKNLTFTGVCEKSDVESGDCKMKLAMYVAFGGKIPGIVKSAASRRVKLASGSATVREGTRKKIRLTLTREGRRIVARGKRVKVVLDVSVTRNGRTGKARLPTVLKARRR